MRILLALYIFLLVAVPCSGASNSDEQKDDQPVDSQKQFEVGDPELDVLWITEKNGEFIPLDTVFRDEDGDDITLGEIIDRPTLILPVYFYCPSSCSLNLVNLAMALKRSKMNPGDEYKIIAYSFNDEEDDSNARIAKRNYLRLLPKGFKEENWKFLTGSAESIKAITDSLGYRFKAQGDGTFIHPSALIAVAEDGKIIKYVYGSFVVGDVDLAVNEASSGIPAMSIKRFLGYCFNYDPQKSRTFFQNLKLSVLLGFAVLGILFFLYVRMSGNKKAKSTKEQ